MAGQIIYPNGDEPGTRRLKVDADARSEGIGMGCEFQESPGQVTRRGTDHP
jgi:hypothetical protein